MSRRLLNRNGESSARSRSKSTLRANPTPTASGALPDYEPPECPLSNEARRSLGELIKDRVTAPLNTQIGESLRLLGMSVGDLHERLRLQREKLENTKARRAEKGTGLTEDDERLEKHVEKLQSQVDSLTKQSEEAVRDLIDRRAELEDEGVVLNDLYAEAATSHAEALPNRRTRGMDAEDDQDVDAQDDENVPVSSTLHAFQAGRDRKLAEYTSMSAYERYALNNDYAAFKKVWHDTMTGDEGIPLPDASRWFRADGQPNIPSAGGVNADGEDSDDDIAVAREVLSVNCPLTLRPMDQPYSNRKCKHTFEKSAILDYLPLRGTAQCPQTGCSQTFSRVKFNEEFYLDQAMMRRVQRAKQAQEQRSFEDDEDEDGDADGNSSRSGSVI